VKRIFYILLLFALSLGTTVTDIDGNVYETVLIGEQLWMAENLKVTHYNDGSEIPNITNNGEWGGLSNGAYGDYNNNPTNSETYGRLYNWHTVNDDKGVCPDGWHVPSDEEYTIITDYLGGESVAGGKMKEAGHEHWNYHSDEVTEEATNESGFTGLPAGFRHNSTGNYNNMGTGGYFWSPSELSINNERYRFLSTYSSGVNRSLIDKQCGVSIRCLADEITTGCTDPEACNYDETANVDDGSCEYTSCDGTLLVPDEYSTIQSAIDAASEGDSVLVSVGTYVENITWPATNGIKLIGSGENNCIIDGNQAASVIRFEEDLGGIIDTTTLITGFTIQNGLAPVRGGGVYCSFSSPSLMNLVIRDNSIDDPTGLGGGVYCSFSSPNLVNITITNNETAGAGAGFYCNSSNPILVDVMIGDNSAGDGGGIFLTNGSNPTLTNTTITGNYASGSGGAPCCYFICKATNTKAKLLIYGHTPEHF